MYRQCEHLYLQAVAYIEELNDSVYPGHDDWRLPTQNELHSLFDFSLRRPVTRFPDTTVAGWYWSSTAAALFLDRWVVSLYYGEIYESEDSGPSLVRAVRGGACRANGDWCIDDGDCAEGEVCVEGECQTEVVDNPPAITAGPYLAAGWWPLLPTSAGSAFVLDQDYGEMWKFSDDYASCPGGACTNAAEYQKVGDSEWTTFTVNTDPTGKKYAYVELPVETLQNATTYAFRFTVTDCANQSAQSGTYYFCVATSDAPPVIGDGPFVAADTWPVLSRRSTAPTVLDQDYAVLWTFSDDYASCSGLCTHCALYRKVGDTTWTGLAPVSADPTGKKYAYVTLPAGRDVSVPF